MEIDDTYQTDLQLRKLGKEAAAKWGSEEACTISDAVAEVVKEAGVSGEKIKRVVEHANTYAYLDKYASSDNKYVSFPEGALATYDGVISKLNNAEPSIETHYDLSDYFTDPDSHEADDIEFFPRNSSADREIDLEKAASQFNDLLDKSYEERLELKKMLKEAESKVGYYDTRAAQELVNLSGHIKEAYVAETPMGDIIRSMRVTNVGDDIIKIALAYTIPKLVDGGYATAEQLERSLQEETTAKLANYNHPLVQSTIKLAEHIRNKKKFAVEVEKIAGVLNAAKGIFSSSANLGGGLAKMLGAAEGGVLHKAGRGIGYLAPVAGGLAAGKFVKDQLGTSPTVVKSMSYVPYNRFYDERLGRRRMMLEQRLGYA